MTTNPNSQANHLQLVAALVARSALRYTPAGLAVCELDLLHNGVQDEAGTPRTVQFTVQAVALGVVALQLEAVPLGATCNWFGFLASRSRGSKTLIFHVSGFVSG